MKRLPWLSLFWFLVFSLVGCVPKQGTHPPSSTISPAPTGSLLIFTPSTTVTVTPFDTLEPVNVTQTLQPLFQESMNCAVPCFWGIVPGKTSFDKARSFFSKLGFIPFEGTFEGRNFYTISYNAGTGHDSSVTLTIDDNLVENIEITPDIPKPKQGSPRAWIAYSPETLIKRYGKPSRVEFTVGWGPNIGINMIMYFDVSDLIVHYSGYDMTPSRFCPLTAPFDHVRLWLGPNPPDTPSFETVPLEKATSLTIDQFTQLVLGDPRTACFALKEDAFR